MLLTRKNKEGYIYAYFEWDIVNEYGYQNNNGNYMYVRDLWVHPDFSGRHCIIDFIRELEEDVRNKDVLWIYWERQKRNGEKVFKTYRRSTALRRILWEVQQR